MLKKISVFLGILSAGLFAYVVYQHFQVSKMDSASKTPPSPYIQEPPYAPGFKPEASSNEGSSRP